MSDVGIGQRAIPSRFGPLLLAWRETESGPRVLSVHLAPLRTGPEQVGGDIDPHPVIDDLCERISRYLDGEVVQLPIAYLDASCCSEFQWRVLMVERTIPRGRVCSYSRLAALAGNPRAARAVGSALARNPFPIIIPCHRTVRSDGTLGGFGGGLPMKRALLEMEGVSFDRRDRVQPDCFWASDE
jgi:methylated-DNA-[protein]-cysteine S-methyltransferase